jgi:predicted transcriptional regulator
MSKKDDRFDMKIFSDHKERLTKRADELGISLADFLTMVGLSARINIEVGKDPTLSQLKDAKEMLETGLINRTEFDKIKSSIFDGEGYKALKSTGHIK